MNAHGWFNALEAIFWMMLGVLMAVKSRSASVENRRIAVVAAAALVLFGVTDLIEILTGAWYTPVALLVFNALCFLTLLGCALRYRTIRKRPLEDDN